ncbi:MAG: TlpA disulfide reductase family protein [Myxococcota bacterium]
MTSLPEHVPAAPSRADRWLRVVPWLVAAGGVYAVGWALQGETMPTGEPAPDFRVTLATEEHVELTEPAEFDLSAQRGQVVVLNFWADWCPPCRAEAPALQTVARELEATGDVLLGLAVERRSLASAERLGMHYPQAFAPPEMAALYKVSMLPTTVVIDPAGRVAEVFVGGIDADALREAAQDARDSVL